MKENLEIRDTAWYQKKSTELQLVTFEMKFHKHNTNSLKGVFAAAMEASIFIFELNQKRIAKYKAKKKKQFPKGGIGEGSQELRITPTGEPTLIPESKFPITKIKRHPDLERLLKEKPGSSSFDNPGILLTGSDKKSISRLFKKDEK